MKSYGKKIIASVLSVILLLTVVTSVAFAEENTDSEAPVMDIEELVQEVSENILENEEISDEMQETEEIISEEKEIPDTTLMQELEGQNNAELKDLFAGLNFLEGNSGTIDFDNMSQATAQMSVNTSSEMPYFVSHNPPLMVVPGGDVVDKTVLDYLSDIGKKIADDTGCWVVSKFLDAIFGGGGDAIKLLDAATAEKYHKETMLALAKLETSLDKTTLYTDIYNYNLAFGALSLPLRSSMQQLIDSNNLSGDAAKSARRMAVTEILSIPKDSVGTGHSFDLLYGMMTSIIFNQYPVLINGQTKYMDLFDIYKTLQRLSFPWEHEAQESMDLFFNSVISEYTVLSFVELLSLKARYDGAIERGLSPTDISGLKSAIDGDEGVVARINRTSERIKEVYDECLGEHDYAAYFWSLDYELKIGKSDQYMKNDNYLVDCPDEPVKKSPINLYDSYTMHDYTLGYPHNLLNGPFLSSGYEKTPYTFLVGSSDYENMLKAAALYPKFTRTYTDDEGKTRTETRDYANCSLKDLLKWGGIELPVGDYKNSYIVFGRKIPKSSMSSMDMTGVDINCTKGNYATKDYSVLIYGTDEIAPSLNYKVSAFFGLPYYLDFSKEDNTLYDIQKEINEAQDGVLKQIYLNSNICDRSDIKSLVIPAGKKIQLSLNGYSLYIDNDETQNVIDVYGTLTICDEHDKLKYDPSPCDGKIVGQKYKGNPTCGVYVHSGGKLTFNAGSIAYNSGKSGSSVSGYQGCGIYGESGSTIKINGGVFYDNESCGLYSKGTVSISGSSSTHEKSIPLFCKNGTGVYLDGASDSNIGLACFARNDIGLYVNQSDSSTCKVSMVEFLYNNNHGIYAKNGSLSMNSDVHMYGNTNNDGTGGAALYADNVKVTMTKTHIQENTCQSNKGAVYLSGSKSSITFTSFVDINNNNTTNLYLASNISENCINIDSDYPQSISAYITAEKFFEGATTVQIGTLKISGSTLKKYFKSDNAYSGFTVEVKTENKPYTSTNYLKLVKKNQKINTVDELKKQLREMKENPKDYSHDMMMGMLDAYEMIAQNKEYREQMQADQEFMQLIDDLTSKVKVQNHRVEHDNYSVMLLGTGTNGTDAPNWRYILSSKNISVPDEIKAKLGDKWKVLASEDISVTAYENKAVSGKFMLGFSGKDFASYKNKEVIVYHLTDKGVEALKATWNEEKQCFTVITESCSPFVLAAKTGSDVPETGDESNVLLWIVLGGMALAAMAGCFILLRKRAR